MVLGEQLNAQAFTGISLIFAGLVVLIIRRPYARRKIAL